MNLPSSLLFTLAAAGTLSAAPAFALEATSGPGMMRCTVVLSRLSSREAADRMPVLSWAQGYLSGIASVDGGAGVPVPSYDELQPRIQSLCRAEPTLDLFHVARQMSARRVASR